MPNTTPNDSLDVISATLDELNRRMRKARHELRLAEESEEQAKRTLALRHLDVRTTRDAVHAIQLEAARFLGAESPKPDYPTTIGWDEVWCPHCSRTFVPSKPGGIDVR